MAEISLVALLFPLYCGLYMIAPLSSYSQLMQKPFMKFLIHASSYLFFLCKQYESSIKWEITAIKIFVYSIDLQNSSVNISFPTVRCTYHRAFWFRNDAEKFGGPTETSAGQRTNIPRMFRCDLCHRYSFLLNKNKYHQQKFVKH